MLNTKRELAVLHAYTSVVVKPRSSDYLVDGVRYPRVTTALGIINKPALVPWAKRVALAKVSDVLLDPAVRAELVMAIEETPAAYAAFVERVVERASKAPDEARDARGDAGTETHRIIQAVVGLIAPTQLAFIPEEYQPAAGAAREFLSDFGISVCDTERVVWSPSAHIAGTIDGVGFRGTKLVIWDWKTGAHIYWETALQLAAYAHLLTELTGRAVEEAYAVRLPPPGDDVLPWPGGYEAKLLTASMLAEGWDRYCAALALHEASKQDWWEAANE